MIFIQAFVPVVPILVVAMAAYWSVEMNKRMYASEPTPVTIMRWQAFASVIGLVAITFIIGLFGDTFLLR